LRPAARRALTIGINYMCLPANRGRLSGCINDSDTMIGIMTSVFGFQESQICRLRDDRGDCMPTRENMLKAMQWLTGGAQAGDEMFFHYSGHGGQMEDRKGDELDGKDETLIPCDFQHAGQITDDELHASVVHNLPKGCRLWVILDCCHSGSALDLRYKVELSANGRSAKIKKKEKSRITTVGQKPTKAEVIMLSGCKDSQTSADIGAGSLGVKKAAGAMTTAFKHTVDPTISCHKLLQRMRRFLKRNDFDQVPQLSSEQYIQLDSGFVEYEGKSKAKFRPGAKVPFAAKGKAPTATGPSSPRKPSHAVDADNYLASMRINKIEGEIHRIRYGEGTYPKLGQEL